MKYADLKERILDLSAEIKDESGERLDPEFVEALQDEDDENMLQALKDLKESVLQAMKEVDETDVWYVYHHIHVNGDEKKPKLFITDVPKDETVSWDLVDEYEQFGEFGSKHANHGIAKLTSDSPTEVKRVWRKKQPSAATAVSYNKLEELKNSV